jgi:hypothetical protein
MIVEMRTYKTKPGRRSEFLEILQSKTYSGTQRNRNENIGSISSVENPGTVFWIRGFPDAANVGKV